MIGVKWEEEHTDFEKKEGRVSLLALGEAVGRGGLEYLIFPQTTVPLKVSLDSRKHKNPLPFLCS